MKAKRRREPLFKNKKVLTKNRIRVPPCRLLTQKTKKIIEREKQRIRGQNLGGGGERRRVLIPPCVVIMPCLYVKREELWDRIKQFVFGREATLIARSYSGACQVFFFSI